MSVNVSKCSGWDGRVNELEEMSSGDFDTREAWKPTGYSGLFGLSRLVSLVELDNQQNQITSNEEGGFLERVEQLFGNFQVAPTGAHFDVRLGDAVEIAPAGHQHIQPFG